MPIKHIFANGEDIATITASGAAASVSYIHTDHLGGTNVTTDNNGNISELLDYYPYGSSRLDQQTSFNEQRKFIGEQYDAASQLSYLNARYYNGSQGRFLSQDPVFWEVGQTSDGKAALANPQAMNSYAYANGNPVTYKDPSGRCPMCIGAVALAIIYGPQILSYGQSLLAPIGQLGISQAIDNAKSGNYGWAAFSALTAGEVPSAGYSPAFEGLWTAGSKESRAANAMSHAADHAAEFGLKGAGDYIRATRDFIAGAINKGLPTKLESREGFDILRTFDSGSNTFSAFEVNKSTNAITPRTMFKPDSASYFGSRAGTTIDIFKYFHK